jgi:pterin-4a-carbinolamine dehydratase
MTKHVAGIRFRKGPTDILIIAPHAAVITDKAGTKIYKNDRRTGIIAEELQKQLRCYAIINDSFLKPTNKYPQNLINHRLDLYKLVQAKKHPEFLDHIKKVADSDGHILILWIHGMEDGSALNEGREHIQRKLFNGGPSDLQALIGYGQGEHPGIESMLKPSEKEKSDSFTAKIETAEKFENFLNKFGLKSLITRPDAGNFRGRDPKRLNQWFVNQNYTFEQVESLQIEIRKQNCRDSRQHCQDTAQKIAKALKKLAQSENESKSKSTAKATRPQETNAMVEAVSTIQKKLPGKVKETQEAIPADIKETAADEVLVDKAYKYLKGIFVNHFQNAMLDAGRYLIKEFYGGKFDNAREGKRIKKESLNKLNKRLEEGGHAPKKTWIYDAVKLAVDDHDLKDLSVYGKLGHSHKVLLTHVSEKGTKRQLVKDAVENEYTVDRLREEIKKHRNGDKLTLDHILTREELDPLEIKELERLKDSASNKSIHHQLQHKIFKTSLKHINRIIAEKENGSKGKKGKFQDWTYSKNNVNFCTGCENDCVYCYMKPMSEPKPNWKKPEDWHRMEIRQHDVDQCRFLKEINRVISCKLSLL